MTERKCKPLYKESLYTGVFEMSPLHISEMRVFPDRDKENRLLVLRLIHCGWREVRLLPQGHREIFPAASPQMAHNLDTHKLTLQT
jgi:hypothetical protein